MSDLPRHRGGKCDACDGVGFDVYDCEDEDHDDFAEDGENCPGCPKCDACEGAGDILWEWYPNYSDGECTECKTEGLDVMGTGEDGEEGAVCRACYIKWHAAQCGCVRWGPPPCGCCRGSGYRADGEWPCGACDGTGAQGGDFSGYEVAHGYEL